MSRWVRSCVGTVAAAVVLSACTAPDQVVAATGRVVIAETVIAAPALAAPTYQPESDPDDPRAPAARSPHVRVTALEVSEGQQVTSGQVLVRLDAAPLTAQVGVAQATLGSAIAQESLLATTITDIAKNRTTVSSAIGKLDAAIATLTTNRRRAATQLAAARRQLATLPESPPPPQAQQVGRARARLRAAVEQLQTALGRLDSGLVRARAQRRNLTAADSRLADAAKQARDLRELARIGVAAARVSVRLAQAQERDATITAPAAGVVTRLPRLAEVLAPGATLVVVSQPAVRVAAWLPPAQAARLCPDDTAIVTADWLPAAREAHITAISPTAEYPPTHQATGEVHLTRAIRIEVTVAGAGLPAGAPADLSLTPCHQN